MNLPRFRLPRRRHPRAGRHLHPGTRATTSRTRSTRSAPGPRTAVGGAMAVLAVTAATATAVTGGPAGAESSPTQATVAAGGTMQELAEGPTVVVSADETAVRASTALQRATDVTEDQASLSKAQEKKIEAQAAEVADLLDHRDADTASRSGARTPLPQDAATTDATSGDPTTDPSAGAGDAANAGTEAAGSAPTQDGAQDGAPTDASAAEILAANRAAAEAAADQAAEPSDATAPAADGTADAETTDGGTADDAAPAAPGEAEAAELDEATDELETLLDAAQTGAVAVEAAPETPAEVTAAQAAAAKKAAPALAAFEDSVVGYGNGQIPSDELCELDFAPGETLRCDAAEQLERLDVAYQARFGEHLAINDSYRSYAAQVETKAARGAMAAVPGYSNHGWGVAVDLNGGVETFGTARYEWLRENGPKFGWDNPGWARADGRKPEAWHWEYTPLG